MAEVDVTAAEMLARLGAERAGQAIRLELARAKRSAPERRGGS